RQLMNRIEKARERQLISVRRSRQAKCRAGWPDATKAAELASYHQMTAGAAPAGSFDELLGALLEPAYLLAVAMLGDRSLAEDAVQEASIKAWRGIHTVRDTNSLRSWFLSIVANQCRSLRRARWWSVRPLLSDV